MCPILTIIHSIFVLLRTAISHLLQDIAVCGRIAKVCGFVVVIPLVMPTAAQAQYFENLDFESAIVSDFHWWGVPISEGLPTWSGGPTGISGIPDSILYNSVTLGSSALALIGPGGFSSSVISGTYSALLIGGWDGSAWIEQTAWVPSDAKSIRVKVRQGDIDEVGVSLDYNSIPMFVIQKSTNYSIRAGDITSFSGIESKLTISAGAWGEYGINPTYIDDIEFSSQALSYRIIGLSGNLAFGNVMTGQTATGTMTITNSGNAALAVTGIGYPAGFSGAWSGSIAPGKSTNVTVVFSPVAVAIYGGTVTVTNDAPINAGMIGIAGTGVSGRPQAQADAKFGVLSNRFGFNIKWANSRVVVVDGCTNLANPIWSPLQTNILTNGWSNFSDPKWSNLISRFYRIRAP